LAQIIVLVHRHSFVAWSGVLSVLALLALGLFDSFARSLNLGFDFKHLCLFFQSSFLSFLFTLKAELLRVIDLLLRSR
jgi:hypothetical protein